MVLLEEWMDACGREEKEEGKREERRTEDEGEDRMPPRWRIRIAYQVFM